MSPELALTELRGGLITVLWVAGPLLLVQGTEDPIIAPESTTALAERQCAAGATVELRPAPGRHDVVLAQGDAIAQWFTERSAGVPATSSCSP